MKRDLVVAGKAIGGAGLTGVILYLVATAPTHVHVYWPYWVLVAMILVGVVLFSVVVSGQRPSRSQQGVAQPASRSSIRQRQQLNSRR